MKRRPSKNNESLTKWIEYLESKPEDIVVNADLVRVLRLIVSAVDENEEKSRELARAADASRYVANYCR